jgi:hypothetical protein
MKRLFAATAALLLSLTLPNPAFSQAVGTLGGIVQDATGALIPGVDLTATNQDTTVARTVITNASGAYTFAAMQAGVYDVSAVLPGFQTSTVTDVRVGANATFRLDFELAVAGAATQVEVSVSAGELSLESSSSIGEVLQAAEVQALPTVSNNVLDLINIMAGVTRQTEGFVLGIQGDFAGVSAQNINVMRDGVSVTDQRWSSAGLNSTTIINPDMVGEMRMILAPVDAETGRGNGQVQITTRSGGNEFHGAAVWNVKNTAFDSRTFGENATAGGPPPVNWDNYHQATVNFGGPIVRNQTYFFALYDQFITKTRDVLNVPVLTPCMQMGIFRYFDGWDNGYFNQATATGGTNPVRPSVNADGTPSVPTEFPDGSAHNGILRHVNLFGEVSFSGAPANDCSNATPTATAPTGTGTWDQFRTDFDSSGFFDLQNSRAPVQNNFEQCRGFGDGLNVSCHRWSRTIDGRDNLFGVGEPNPRKQINIKIDHIFNQEHKVATSYSLERVNADDTPEGWVDSFEGRLFRQPQVLSVNLTSTLAANIVNEVRFGMTRMGTNVRHATQVPENREALLALLPESNGLFLIPQYQTGTIAWAGESGGLIGARGNGPSAATVIDTSPRWTIGDTMSWTEGVHSLRFGGEYRIATSKTEEFGDINNNSLPVFFLGSTALAPNDAFDIGTVGGYRDLNGIADTDLRTNNSNAMRDLLVFLSASLDSVDTARFINTPAQAGTEWNDALAGELVAIRDLHQNEFAAFVKDDWKVTDNLTLNLGLRWDYYGVPYDEGGMTTALAGGSNAIFGRTGCPASGNCFDNWFQQVQDGTDVEFIFIGPNSPNPDLQAYPKDLNNFGPAVGFSYNVPGTDDRTTFRGGYQLSYLGGGDGQNIDPILQTPPGSLVRAEFAGIGGGEYFDLADVVGGLGVPPEPTFLPALPVPVTDRVVDLRVFDANFRQPYIQNITAQLTHRLSSRVTLDAKYVATLSRGLIQNLELNEANLFQNGMFEALVAARAGEDPPLLDTLFAGLDLRTGGTPGTGSVVGVTPDFSGADFLRTDTRFRNNLADGNFTALGDALNDLTYVSALNPTLPACNTGELGCALRAPAGGVRPVQFPENFFYTSPQFDDAQIRTNLGHANYHSLQTEFTLRPTYGVNMSASYTFAKNLGRSSANYTLPWDRAMDYRRSGRTHNFRSFGSFNLPLGPGQLVLGNSSGFIARAIEGWQMSWIYGANSGGILNPTSTAGLYGGSEPILASGATFPADGKVSWVSGDLQGTYFDGDFVRGLDPVCTDPTFVAQGVAGYTNQCDRNALYTDVNANGTFESGTDTLLLRTPLPGEVGTFRDELEGPGNWTLDMAMSKRIQVSEDVNMEIRADATNIFNHPNPAAPNIQVQPGFGTAPFGNIATKTGNRVFQFRARLDF